MDLDPSSQADWVNDRHSYQPADYGYMPYSSSKSIDERLAITASWTGLAGDQAIPVSQDCSASSSTAFDGKPNQWNTSRSKMMRSLPRQSQDSGLPSSSNSSEAPYQYFPQIPQQQSALDHSTIAACSSWLAKYGLTMPPENTMGHLSLAFGVTYEAVLQWFSSQMVRGHKVEGETYATMPTSEAHPVFNLRPSERKCKHMARAKQNAQVNTGRFHTNEKPLFVCTSRCGATFTTKAGWKRHEGIKRPQRLWRCQYLACQITLKNGGYFSRKSGLKEHYWKIHSIKCSQQELLSYENPIEWQFDEPCIFRICPERFLDWDEWIEHIGKHFESDVWEISQWRDTEGNIGATEGDDEMVDRDSSSDPSSDEVRSEYDDDDPDSSRPGDAPDGSSNGRSGGPDPGFPRPPRGQRRHGGHSGSAFGGLHGSQLDLHSLDEKLAGISGGRKSFTPRAVIGFDDPIWMHLASWTRRAVTNLSLKCQPMVAFEEERLGAVEMPRILDSTKGTAQPLTCHLFRANGDGAYKETWLDASKSIYHQTINITFTATVMDMLQYLIPNQREYLLAVSHFLRKRESACQQPSNVSPVTSDAALMITKAAKALHTRSKSTFHLDKFAHYSLLSSLGIALVETSYTAASGYLQMPGDVEDTQGAKYINFLHTRRLAESARTEMNRRSYNVVDDRWSKDDGRLKPQLNGVGFTKTYALPTVKSQQRKLAKDLSALACINISLAEAVKVLCFRTVVMEQVSEMQTAFDPTTKALQSHTHGRKKTGLYQEQKTIESELSGRKGEPHTDSESETSVMPALIGDTDDSTLSDVTSVSTSSLRVHDSDALGDEAATKFRLDAKRQRSARPPTNTYSLPFIADRLPKTSTLKMYLENDEDNYQEFLITGKSSWRSRAECSK